MGVPVGNQVRDTFVVSIGREQSARLPAGRFRADERRAVTSSISHAGRRRVAERAVETLFARDIAGARVGAQLHGRERRDALAAPTDAGTTHARYKGLRRSQPCVPLTTALSESAASAGLSVFLPRRLQSAIPFSSVASEADAAGRCVTSDPSLSVSLFPSLSLDARNVRRYSTIPKLLASPETVREHLRAPARLERLPAENLVNISI